MRQGNLGIMVSLRYPEMSGKEAGTHWPGTLGWPGESPPWDSYHSPFPTHLPLSHTHSSDQLRAVSRVSGLDSCEEKGRRRGRGALPALDLLEAEALGRGAEGRPRLYNLVRELYLSEP